MTESTLADREAIDDLFERSRATYKAGDLEGFVGCFDDNTICLSPGEQPIIGKESWRAWLSGWWESSTVIEYQPTHEAIDIAGDWAIEWHTDQTTMPAEGGEQSESYYKGILVLRRQADNSWKIARYCWNGYPGPS